jgi:hypothetical protein
MIPAGPRVFETLFGTTAALGIAYLGVILFLTRDDVHIRPAQTHAAHHLLFRYFPGPVLLVAMMMGVGFVVTTVFLTRHVTVLGLPGVRTFFTGYAVSAFIIRMLTRQWSYTIGRHRMILMGLSGHCIGHLLLVPVSSEWGLLLPSMACGFGHALLFPCVISLGAGAFPVEYRGSGTTITMGFMDLGVFLSAPLLGWVIDAYGFSTMFMTSAALAFTVGVMYAVLTHGAADSDRDVAPPAFAVDEVGDIEVEAEQEPASRSPVPLGVGSD